MCFEYCTCSIKHPDISSHMSCKDISFAKGTGGKKVPAGWVFLLS